MKKILFIATGGTIASKKTENGLTPQITPEELLSYIPEVEGLCEITAVNPFNLDSSNVVPENWSTLVKVAKEHYEDYDGFVIAHGTDTMAYTAAVLSYMIQNPEKPIVLTGAQKPIGFEITDAKANLQDSILYAADPCSKGVQIVFAGKVIAGTHARKARSMSVLAFESINLPVIAEINSGRIIRYLKDDAFYRHAPESKEAPQPADAPQPEGAPEQAGAQQPADACAFYDRIDPDVFLLKLTPGMSPVLIPAIFQNYDAVIVESFGAGGIPDSIEATLFEELSKYEPEEKILAMTTQVTYEGSRLETYEVGRRIKDSFKILESRDMTLEATVAKLMWILANKEQTWEEIEDRFYTPVAMDTLVGR